MPLAVQYFNGTEYQQFGLTTDDITSSGIVCNSFWAIKDSVDNCFIFCGSTTNFVAAKIIRIDKNGTKTIGSMLNVEGFGTNNTGYVGNTNANHTLSISRDSSLLFINCSSDSADVQHLQSVPTNFSNGDIIPVKVIAGVGAINYSIYQDRYIWVASGNTVRIYDYDTKVELASKLVTNTGTVINIACSVGNLCYTIGTNEGSPAGSTLSRLTFNGVNSISQTALASSINFYTSAKQLLIDKWGDLIILTNSGTASTLLKYTTTGVLVDTKNLANPSYNLAIDADGNYFFYTALKEYQINANTAQGQPFTSLGYETRGTGNTGFGSNSTGYQPSVYA